MRTVVVLTVIGSLAEPPADAYDAYLRLHLLSHRLIRPHEADLTGLFGVLGNVAWTSHGPVDPAALSAVRMRFRAAGEPFAVTSIDKFPRMTDYVAPAGVRIADADRVRLGAHLAEGTTVMHEGFVNFNAGTLGASMVEGRISAGVVVGDGSDIGGGASIMGTLSGGGTAVISIGERCLLGANAGPRDLARRRLHRRGGPLRDRRLARDAAGRRGRQGGRAERRRRAAVPAQLADRRDRGDAAQRPLGRPQRRAARQRLMLFRPADLAAIAAGEVTVAFRRWKRPMAKAGGTQHTAVGVVAFDAVDRVERDHGRRRPPRRLRRSRGRLGDAAQARRRPLPDHATARRTRSADRAARGRRAERSRPRRDRGPARRGWTARAATARGRRRRCARSPNAPGTRAADLAERFGRERLPFKADVRKLKALGLTESLEVGYRLSPRGRAYLEAPSESSSAASSST